VTDRAGVAGLFEAHLLAGDLERSIGFYRDVVGLDLARHDEELGAAFLWTGEPGSSMLGLWAAGPAPIALTLHVAFATSVDDVLDAPRRLRASGVTPLGFDTKEADEPSVIAWMPAVAVYFRDPDGHLLEYLAMLDAPPAAERGVISWSEWIAAR
jgi:lactoylglutathione lyase